MLETPRWINTMKIRPRHGIVTVENPTGKGKILKAVKEKISLPSKEQQYSDI